MAQITSPIPLSEIFILPHLPLLSAPPLTRLLALLVAEAVVSPAGAAEAAEAAAGKSLSYSLETIPNSPSTFESPAVNYAIIYLIC